MYGLEVHGEWTSGVICRTTGPFDCALGVRWIASCPSTDLDIHGRLRVLAGLSLSLGHDPHSGTINRPNNLISSPVDAVGVKFVVIIWSTVESPSVVTGSRLPFAKVVALGLGVVAA